MKSILIKALESAGKIQLKSFGNSHKTWQKESLSSVLTKTDIDSEEAILDIIRKHFPGHNILSEEFGFMDNKNEYTWVIDPLDGTSNFAAGIPWFGVLIAVLKENKPVIGGAYLPIQKDLYIAESGKGSYKNNKQIRLKNELPENSLVSISTDYTNNEELSKLAEKLYTQLVERCRNIRSTNSLLELLYVAEGKFGGCINFYTKIWDIAAPWLIIREAGGNLKNINGQEIRFHPYDKDRNYSICGGNKHFLNLFGELLGY